ncbi:thiamine phosphate synthase [soil metagenome]
MPAPPAPRLYLVTPLVLSAPFERELAGLLDAFDIACLRLSLAGTAPDAIRRAAGPLRALCHARDVSMVIADHYRLAPELGLDGVHLLDGARSVRAARQHLGPEAIVGAFARASRHEGMTAAEIGADYVGFGPVAASPLGGGAIAGPDLFAWWSQMIETPVIAEGGLTPELAATLAGSADFIALGDELWSHPDGARAALAAIVARFSG